MGEHADDAVDQALGHYWGYSEDGDEDYGLPIPERVNRRHFQRGTGNHHWRVADGTIMSMHDMTTEHIQNALRFCEEHGNTGKAEQFRYVLDQRRRQGIQVPEGTVTNNLFGLPIKVA